MQDFQDRTFENGQIGRFSKSMPKDPECIFSNNVQIFFAAFLKLEILDIDKFVDCRFRLEFFFIRFLKIVNLEDPRLLKMSNYHCEVR